MPEHSLLILSVAPTRCGNFLLLTPRSCKKHRRHCQVGGFVAVTFERRIKPLMNNPYREAALSAKCQTAVGAIVQETDSNFSFITTTMLPAQSRKMCRLRQQPKISGGSSGLNSSPGNSPNMAPPCPNKSSCFFSRDTYGKQNNSKLTIQWKKDVCLGKQ